MKLALGSTWGVAHDKEDENFVGWYMHFNDMLLVFVMIVVVYTCVCNDGGNGVCMCIIIKFLPIMLQQLPNLHEGQRVLDPDRSENSVFL